MGENENEMMSIKQERLILLGDKLIFTIKLDLTEGEVPSHPLPPPPRGEGGVGEDNQVSLLCNVRVHLQVLGVNSAKKWRLPSESEYNRKRIDLG